MRRIFSALTIAIAMFALPAAAQAPQKGGPAAKGAPPAAAAPAQDAAPDQIALTEQQVNGFISVTPEIAKITAKLQADPDKKTQAQLDALAKKGGLSGYDEYDAVSNNISMVMQGIDPKTKKFGDPKILIQGQIAEVQADKKMKPAEKKQALEELNQAIKDVQPIKNQGNIALVEKNYDKLAPLMQQE